jgi:hypothetical protein
VVGFLIEQSAGVTAVSESLREDTVRDARHPAARFM